eukprot:5053575-Prymnesium_polylepis.1
MGHVLLWARQPHRFCFHLLAGERCLAELALRPLEARLASQGLRCEMASQIQIVNATNAELLRRLSPLGRE